MKKICIIFRGENERPKVNINININNLKKYIFDDLSVNNYNFEVIFVTYESSSLNNLIEKIK